AGELASGKGGRVRGLSRAHPRGDGGIGRRARLRAWSGITGWRFESSSAHAEKPRLAGLFAFSASSPERGVNNSRQRSDNWRTAHSPVFSTWEAAMSVHFDRVRGR